MAKISKHGLGRGLGALLGEDEAANAGEETPVDESAQRVMRLRITDIDPNRDQPRRSFDEMALKELAESILSVGVIQPIVVERFGTRYRLIAGERRWRASRMAGLDDIPAIIRNPGDENRLELALIENLQRDDLNAVEQATAIKSLMDECGYTQENVAKRLGKSRPAIANLLRILTLSEEVRQLVAEGKLSAGHAKALASIEDEQVQLRLANLCVSQGWSVRQLEKVCQQTLLKRPRQVPVKTPEMIDLERMARDAFGTRTQLEGDEKKGRLIVNYYSPEDLQRIWDILEVLSQNN